MSNQEALARLALIRERSRAVQESCAEIELIEDAVSPQFMEAAQETLLALSDEGWALSRSRRGDWWYLDHSAPDGRWFVLDARGALGLVRPLDADYIYVPLSLLGIVGLFAGPGILSSLGLSAPATLLSLGALVLLLFCIAACCCQLELYRSWSPGESGVTGMEIVGVLEERIREAEVRLGEAEGAMLERAAHLRKRGVSLPSTEAETTLPYPLST